ncbi:MAG TPA: DMT family transporter [Pyrinomonadaceae bacterium]|jgi:drug/metabolite transporter (DMT)-like permease
MKTFLLTSFALACFAFNSILCRLALKTNEIDAVGFTLVRIASGVVMLLIISLLFGRVGEKKLRGKPVSAFFLFAYAACFSLAYINLTTGTGALILFGSVQATMIAAALAAGERPRALEWVGFVAALGGLIYLVFPGLAAPPLASSALMALAGVAWGFYSLRGRGVANPLAETAGNFVIASFMIILVSLPFLARIHSTPKGLTFAILSGACASGIGYSVWYAALKFHTATRAAILQLAVPLLAAVGGVIFLAEEISIRLVLAAASILGGIALAIFGKTKSKAN